MKEGTPSPGGSGALPEGCRVVQNACDADTLISPHKKAHTMLRAGSSLRFTPDEIEEFRSLGLDFEGERTREDIEQALAAWAEVLADERPDLLDMIVTVMAKTAGV